jgi:hypothetical protein
MAGKKKATDRHKVSTSQLLNFVKDSYLERTSRPIYAILFLLPFILFYEIGTGLINTNTLNQTQVRVVAFVWLQEIFRYVGCDERMVWVAPPLVVVLVLLGLQLASRKPWSFYPHDMAPMAGECVLLAVPLIVLSLFLNTQFHRVNSPTPPADPPAAVSMQAEVNTTLADPNLTDGEVQSGYAGPYEGSLLASVVTSIGAGIYEELVFRLILMILLVMFFQDLLRTPYTNAVILSVFISAALFSAHHHVLFVEGRVGSGIPFTWTEFAFRTLAGVYFSALFAVRGFGITAGAHVFYDIMATILNAVYFTS